MAQITYLNLGADEGLPGAQRVIGEDKGEGTFYLIVSIQ
jgi:hypothetical protein